MPQPIIVKCPNCQKRVFWTIQSFYKPFCSERCKLTDLGAWASEENKIIDRNDNFLEQDEKQERQDFFQ